MKRALSILWLLCAHHLHAADQSASLRFVNGDRIDGSPISLGPEGIVWNSPLLEKEAVFPGKHLLTLMLPPQLPPQQDAAYEATVSLTNGDKIRGQLAEVTPEHVMLDTWFAGRMKLNRLMVDDVTVEDAAKLLYRGPTGIQGWTVSPAPDAWQYSSFKFLTNGSGAIARDDILSDQCSVSFDVDWDADYLKMKIALFSDPVDSPDTKIGYELSLQRGSMVMRNCRTQAYLGSAHSAELAQGNQARIEIRGSRTSGKVAILVNGNLLEIWQDPDFKNAKLGKGLHFISDGSSYRLSRIHVAEWDGEVDEPMPARMGMRRFPRAFGQEPPQQPALTEETNTAGRMKLANGDSIEGKVTAIREGKVTLESPMGTFTLPVERLRSIALPPSPREVAYRENGDVRAWLADGATIVFDLKACDDQTITGSSQNFGTVTFRRDAFQRLDFNIHYYEYDELRGQLK